MPLFSPLTCDMVTQAPKLLVLTGNSVLIYTLLTYCFMYVSLIFLKKYIRTRIEFHIFSISYSAASAQSFLR